MAIRCLAAQSFGSPGSEGASRPGVPVGAEPPSGLIPGSLTLGLPKPEIALVPPWDEVRPLEGNADDFGDDNLALPPRPPFAIPGCKFFEELEPRPACEIAVLLCGALPGLVGSSE